MAKLGVTQLEQATEIPNGSLHIVEMGDGSGTKAVTQETLAEETGKALKVGNLAELQTEDKTSLVAAINEAAQSGGGGTPVEVDVLDTQEEIEANTEAGKAAGALAVKEMFDALNDNLRISDKDWSEYLNGYITQYMQNPICTFLRFGKIFIVTLSGTLKQTIPNGKDTPISTELPISLSYNGIPEVRMNCGLLKTWDGKILTAFIENKKLMVSNYGYNTDVGKVFCQGYIVGMIP